MKRTFVEKFFDASAGTIVFKKPDLVLTHDNTASIKNTFSKMKGEKVFDADHLLVVLDHNAPPTNAKLANQYQSIREFTEQQGITKFYDVGNGICHELMRKHAKPGMLIVGSDSHTCTAGAFNTMAVGIDRTEAAGIWKRGETWFRVPETLKITLTGKLKSGVFAKDISLWIIGLIGSSGANYMSIEFHGDGLNNLSISDRMTIANLASEMGAKNAIFPPDEILKEYYESYSIKGIWADEGANYAKEIGINLNDIYPVVAAPHHVDNIKAISEIKEKKIQQALIGTCTNGRIEDLRIAAKILENKKVNSKVQLMIIPASKEIYLQAINEGLISKILNAGAQVLSPSCGPCLGTGQGIPADNTTIISTANRNFKGRMGNPNAEIYLASTACVAKSAIAGKITDPRSKPTINTYPSNKETETLVSISKNENRKQNGVWNYSDVNNLNTDQMFAGKLTYDILSSDPESIIPHLFEDFDSNFSGNLESNDIIIAGNNFGCGSSREHPAVGLSHAGVKAIIVKSVNRIFYRSCINQGLLLLVLPEVVEAYNNSSSFSINIDQNEIIVDAKQFTFPKLPKKLIDIINQKGLVNAILAEE